ncbi:MAG: squalene/phytoene synthase family protein [Thiobacillus sp.]|nr:squalene/phytoene synthase family protein [Thiobacillus sp.]
MSADVHRYCQERAAASGSSFYYSFVFLPLDVRRAITAFYALCRELDDVVDECHERQVAEIKLDWWRAEIGRFAGRYPDFRSLRLYCYRVAGVVGEIAAAIFDGARSEHDRDIRRYAHELGLAFQLTNIIRDVGEDARRGRIYLPQDELARFGVAEADLLNGRDTPQFQALMQFQYERALACYDRALATLPPGARRAQRPGLVMAAIYRTLADEIREAGFPVLRARVSLTPLRKLWLAGKTWLFP